MNKNKLMVALAFGTVLIAVIVNMLHRFELVSHMHGQMTVPDYYYFVATLILLVPIVFLILTLIFYFKKKDQPLIPMMVTLTLTFASISTITGGEGMVEYHFSLFMVVAILAYYEKIKLVVIMTVIFVLQHLLGFFIPTFTIFVFGVSNYSFTMVLIHAAFLGITSGATIWQIITKQKNTALLEYENEQSQSTIETIMDQLKTTSAKVLNTVNNLNDSSQESQLMSNQITASIQQMASGADTQLTMAYESGTLLTEMTKGVQQIASSTSIVVEASSQTTEEAKQGKETVLQTANQIETISHSFEEVAKVIADLEKRSTEINEIITVISGISTQTNLLALNAAIEAARAGEYGKGFAVVADEVRKLAEQSEQSVVKVGNLVNEIQLDTINATQSMQVGTKEVKDGILLVNETGNVFERILVAAEKVYQQIHETAAISEQIASGSDQVLNSMNEMTEVAKDTATSSESITHAAEKQKQSTDDINGIAVFLNGLVDELNTLAINLSNKS